MGVWQIILGAVVLYVVISLILAYIRAEVEDTIQLEMAKMFGHRVTPPREEEPASC